jgi:Fe-S-cluster containining protein
MDTLTIEKPWFADGLKFKCTGCGKCCSGPSGYVFLSEPDLERLAAHFSLTPKAFAQKYTRLVDGQYALLDRPNSGDCIFLKDKRCSVYEARPIQCQTFPWWIHNLKEPAEWEEASHHCEGINHPDAPVIDSVAIQTECLTYLDNLLEQNFSL